MNIFNIFRSGTDPGPIRDRRRRLKKHHRGLSPDRFAKKWGNWTKSCSAGGDPGPDSGRLADRSGTAWRTGPDRSGGPILAGLEDRLAGGLGPPLEARKWPILATLADLAELAGKRPHWPGNGHIGRETADRAGKRPIGHFFGPDRPSDRKSHGNYTSV